MELLTFKTLWGHPDNGEAASLNVACRQAAEAGFNGVEGPVPESAEVTESFARALDQRGLAYIAEICTAGSYVPDRTASVTEHLVDLDKQLRRIAPLQPVLVNCLGGCDRWSLESSYAFFQRALELADRYGVRISFETHRGRSLYSPWMAEALLDRITLPLTCDFSHWCVVCEGLGESEYELIQRVAMRAHHIHGRVGFDQGPQVSAPQSSRYREDLERHLLWWRWIWQAQLARGEAITTLTPEFGPDGYQAINPDTDQPIGNLNDINQWMAGRCRAEFNLFVNEPAAAAAKA